MESCPTQGVLPLVGLAAEKVIRDRYKQHNGGSGLCCELVAETGLCDSCRVEATARDTKARRPEGSENTAADREPAGRGRG
ncbi:MAG: hypothetical protein ACQESR_26025 [Planctomycetota bacterium]